MNILNDEKNVKACGYTSLKRDTCSVNAEPKIVLVVQTWVCLFVSVTRFLQYLSEFVKKKIKKKESSTTASLSRLAFFLFSFFFFNRVLRFIYIHLTKYIIFNLFFHHLTCKNHIDHYLNPFKCLAKKKPPNWMVCDFFLDLCIS